MRIMVISATLRRDGNSDTLAEAFARGAREAGHEVEKVSLRDKKVAFCRGCLACQETGRCVIHDDADAIVERMGQADVLAFATPIYYYEMAGQMKTLLDRANPLYASEYRFRDVYLLAAAADEDPHAPDGAVRGLEGWISCFEGARLAGVVFGGGATGIGDMQGNPALGEAYALGKGL